MKFIITGKHCSGKFEILNEIEEGGMKIGHEFSNITSEYAKQIYIDPQYEAYTIHDINQIFENGSFINIENIAEPTEAPGAFFYYKGISFDTFDYSDAIVLNPNQVINLNRVTFPGRELIIWIWVDNSYGRRFEYYKENNLKYNFTDEELKENKVIKNFIQEILSNNPNYRLLYFNNEDPSRIASIILALFTYPDLIELFSKTFRN